MPTDDRDWVVEAAASVPGVRATYHLLDPATGNGLSIAVFDDDEAAAAALRSDPAPGRRDRLERPAPAALHLRNLLPGHSRHAESLTRVRNVVRGR